MSDPDHEDKLPLASVPSLSAIKELRENTAFMQAMKTVAPHLSGVLLHFQRDLVESADSMDEAGRRVFVVAELDKRLKLLASDPVDFAEAQKIDTPFPTNRPKLLPT